MKNLRLPPDAEFVTKIMLLSHRNELLLSKHSKLPIDDVVVNYDCDAHHGEGDEPAS
jgi:hypothetical protein